MENRHKTMNAGKYDFGFAVDWMRKDLGICLDEADRNGAKLPVTALVDQFYEEVQEMGGKRWDTSSLLARLEKMTVLSPASTRRRGRRASARPRLGGEPPGHGALRHQHRTRRSASRTAMQRDIARQIKRNHERALELWAQASREAQFIASLTADPKRSR